jgi:exopolyphosphatase/guanosine-5'-triphosphate,3'-diphosphate pyrophosphatase
MLIEGVSLDTIEKKDENTKDLRSEKLKSIYEIALKYDNDPNHFEKVKQLSLDLFEQLAKLHGLSETERYWLECATLLHDIGWSQGIKAHNKSSLQIILNDTSLPFSSKERYIVGSIARYHRKALPNTKHFHFKKIHSNERKKVEVLSAIIRVADGLDASHCQIVKNIKADIKSKKIILNCSILGSSTMEEQSVTKKKDLFEKTFKRDLELKWITKS